MALSSAGCWLTESIEPVSAAADAGTATDVGSAPDGMPANDGGSNANIRYRCGGGTLTCDLDHNCFGCDGSYACVAADGGQEGGNCNPLALIGCDDSFDCVTGFVCCLHLVEAGPDASARVIANAGCESSCGGPEAKPLCNPASPTCAAGSCQPLGDPNLPGYSVCR